MRSNDLEKLFEWQYVDSIKKEGKIYTTYGDVNAPFISAETGDRLPMRSEIRPVIL